MRIENIKRLLPACFDASVVPFLWGAHGIGKSEIVKQIGEATGRKVIDLRLGLMEVGDLLGMVRGFDTQGRAQYSKPDWFPLGKKTKTVTDKEGNQQIELTDEDEPTILFLDEINRATIPVLQAIFQLVLDRKINLHELPKNCAIVAASNPPGTENDYIVTELDPALLNRFLHLKLFPSEQEFLEYATVQKIDPTITTFLSKAQEQIGYTALEIPIDLEPKPRGWFLFNTLYEGFLSNGNSDLILEVARGLVGETAGMLFYESLKNLEAPVRGIEALNNYAKVRARVRKHANAKGEQEFTRIDLLAVTCREIGVHVKNKQGEEPKKLNAKQMQNLFEFCSDLPNDVLFGFVKDYIKDNRQLGPEIAKQKDLLKRIKNLRVDLEK